ncbi:MAG: MBL fold metallo-hydrolase [Bacteroidales bacterium]|nr:MBL fold metallo-hydrolase [Bacteroidales bacterium]
MIKQFTFNHFEVNCYLIVDDRVPTAGEKRQCAIVDPACEASFEDAQLSQYIEQEHLQVSLILLTHAHVDHIAGLRQCCEHYHLPVTMHADGRKLLKQAEAYGSIMGFAVDNMDDLEVVEIEDNDVISIENGKLRIENSADASNNSQFSTLNSQFKIECRYVPGHCPGSMCFVLPQEKAVITGDALFHFSIGRTDLPGGDYPTLIEKLKTRILTLPDDYRVLPGHGILSQIGKEKKYNSFLI